MAPHGAIVFLETHIKEGVYMATVKTEPGLNFPVLTSYERILAEKRLDFVMTRNKFERWIIQHLLEFAEAVKKDCLEVSLFCPDLLEPHPLESRTFHGYRIVKDVFYSTSFAKIDEDTGMFFLRVTDCDKGIVRVRPLDDHDTENIQKLLNSVYSSYFHHERVPNIKMKLD